jgi:hypothetical protein
MLMHLVMCIHLISRGISDVSALGNVHTLDISYYCGTTDVSALATAVDLIDRP